MNFYIPEIIVYMIGVISIIIVLIDLSRIEKKREQEEKTFKEKAKIKHSVFFFRVRNSSKNRGNANIMFYATRYDYLRIAKAMLDDWQKDTCVGKYLKTIFENRISKDNDKKRQRGDRTQWNFASGYAGQFQTHYKGISKKDL